MSQFAATRALLDYAYHPRFPPARVTLQDALVRAALATGRPPPLTSTPWAVFTSGPMGAGKSYTMRWLSENAAFPLSRFIIVDPDRIKSCLPEAGSLTAANPATAASLLHRESGLIAELMEREALAAGRDVLVDGTLRDAEWYSARFQAIRAAGTHRIGVLLITAPKDVIYARAARRARLTGREVPQAVLDQAIEGVPPAFDVLSRLADYAAVIHNDVDGAAPQFQAPADFETFRKVWDMK